MSFVIAVYVPNAVVLASDSRQMIHVHAQTPDGKPLPAFETVASDYCPKIFLSEKNQVGIAGYGELILDGRRIDYAVNQFLESEVDAEDSVTSTAEKMRDFFNERFSGARTSFYIAGFKKGPEGSIPYVYSYAIGSMELHRANYNEKLDKVVNSCTWGGEGDVLDLLLNGWTVRHPDGSILNIQRWGYLFDLMGPKDAVDFAHFCVTTTVEAIRFQARKKNVGGAVQILLLTPEGAQWVKKPSPG